MAATNGTLSISDLQEARFQSSAEFGLDTINQVLQADLAYFNGVMDEQISLVAEKSADRQRIYGTSAALPMVEVDEFGKARSKKQVVGSSVAFPLRQFKTTLGWTQDYLKTATPAQLAEQYLKARKGYAQQVIRQIKKAIFDDTNYAYIDQHVDNVSLAVKRFANADSAVIPDSPAGVSFAGATHQHYNAMTGSAVANADLNYLVDHVTEHGNTQGVKIIIAQADVTAISALTNFIKAGDAGLIQPFPTTQAAGITTLNTQFDDLENRFLGCYRNSGVQIWVKPWGVAGYAFCFASDAAEKPLVYRQRPQASLQGLRIGSQFDQFPLIAQEMVAEFGFGVWNRVNGAVLDFTHQATWSDPTIS